MWVVYTVAADIAAGGYTKEVRAEEFEEDAMKIMDEMKANNSAATKTVIEQWRPAGRSDYY